MFNDHAKAIRQQFLRASSTELARASKLEKPSSTLATLGCLVRSIIELVILHMQHKVPTVCSMFRAAAVLDGRI